MKEGEDIIKHPLKTLILTFQGKQVMVDRDLAVMYQVPVKRLNEQVKRNIGRFPTFFRFQLTNDEKSELVANCDRFDKLKYSSTNPFVFTEQGVAMLSAVLRSDIAVQVSIKIMTAFVDMRKVLNLNSGVVLRLEGLEQKQLETDNKFDQLFDALQNENLTLKQGIFYQGQIYDAHSFVIDIIKSANKSIILIDNYIDNSVLTMLSNKRSHVNCTILTSNISKQISLDAEKFNVQYPSLEIKKFKKAHDRFLIIDKTEVYHIGASLKDVGKKMFAFSKMNNMTDSILESLKELI